MKRVLLVLGLAVLPLGLMARGHAECTVPELPGVGCLAPGPSASASPSPAPPVTPAPAPTHTEPAPTAAPTAGPTVPPVGLPPGAPVAPVVPVQATQAPAPLLPSATPVAVALPATPLTQVVPSAYAIVVFGLLGVALLAGFLSGLRPAGGTVNAARTRLWAGLSTLAVAAVVGGIGWYRISGEPLLNRQIPFLASAGIAVVVLAVLGGALIVAEQLRADQDRIGELEDAVRALTEALAPAIEKEPRR